MESKSTFFILIIIVAVLALSLAALAGYIFIVQGGSDKPGQTTEDGQDASGKEPVREIPKEADLIKVPLFESTRYFNLKNTTSEKASIIQVNVTLKCHKALKSNKKAVVSDMIAARSEEIQELVVRFFLTLTAQDVKDPGVMDKAREDLTKQINALMNEGAKEPEEIVYRLIFSEWLFQ